MDNAAPDRQWVTCPGCAEAFDPDTEAAAREEAGGTVQCPFCSTRFAPTVSLAAPEAIPSPVAPRSDDDRDEGNFFVVDDQAGADGSSLSSSARYRSSSGADLSTRRVRNLSAARRAMLRLRSWCVVATVSFAVAVVQLATLTAFHVRQHGWFWKPVLYALLVPVAAFWSIHFARRAAAIGRELRKRPLDDPIAPPDFSTLSDGSQQWKNLGGM